MHALALALAPGTFGEDQPDAGRPELEARQAIPNQIGSSLLVRDSTVNSFVRTSTTTLSGVLKLRRPASSAFKDISRTIAISKGRGLCQL